MPRIPAAELERLKREVSLVRLIESQGHVLKKRGRDWVMCCLFHDEATPSLSVSETKNVYHCFGCNASGSVLDWVMKTQGVSLPHAVQLLRSDAPLEAGAVREGVNRTKARHLPSLAADAEEAVLLKEVVASYHTSLLQSPEAQSYLTQRGLVSGEVIETFKLGYANKSLTYRLPPGYSKDGREVREKLQRVGVYRESGHEHLNGCLVVPVLDLETGAVRQMYGRRIASDNKIAANQAKHLYLSMPLGGVWNEAALVASRDVIVCEALIDALTFWCAGYRNVISAFGVNGFTQDHWDALKRHGTERVWIAYDRDDAGNVAAEKLGVELRERGIETWRVLFPRGMDANEYARKVAPAEKSLGLLLNQAEWIGKGRRIAATAVAELVSLKKVNDVRPASSLAAIAEVAAPLAPAAAVTAELEPDAAKEDAPTRPEASGVSATPLMPSMPAAAVLDDLDVKETANGELVFTFGERLWRVRGWQKNLGPEQMRVNAQVRRGDAYHVDTLDVYSAKARAVYLKTAAIELGSQEDTLKRDLGRMLLKLETLQDESIRKTLTPVDASVKIDAVEHAAALEWLKAPDLIARLEADMARCGVVGESTNLLAGYLAAVSRKLDAPLAVLIQSSSAAGKSALMDAVLDLMPEEQRIQYSAMTGQSLFYLGETDLQHKILAIAEEEGVRQAAYALKLLQSDGELSIASTGKDEATGNLVTKQYTVKGPVMLMLTTTAIDVDEELLNRCLVLTINESREQTREIHARQRSKQTLEGLLGETDKQHIVELHRNAQRLIKPVHVVNPFAEQLTFMDDKTRMRRDHMKYLTLIRSIALLHQYQRPHKTVTHRGAALTYIEVTKADIELANRIAHEVLGRTLDELPPQTRRLLKLIHAMVKERSEREHVKRRELRFTRRDVREYTSWSDNQLKVHCMRLVELEYLLVHGGSRGHLLHYELTYDGAADDEPRLAGLIEPEELNNDERKLGSESSKLVPSCPQVGAKLDLVDTVKSQADKGAEAEVVGVTENAYRGEKLNRSSFASVVKDS